MSAVDLTMDNFEQTITDNDIVVVDFWAPWCGPCKAFAPTFEAIAEKNSGIVFGKVNTEDQQELAASFNIRSIPTLMVFRENIILFAQPGALPGNALEDLVAKIQDVDMDQVRAEIEASNENA